MINAIKYLFPNADPLVDFELRDNSDGKGPYIARWDTAKLGAQPTVAALQSVSVAAAATAAANATSTKAKSDLIAIDLASVRAIREYIVSKADAPQILKDLEATAVGERVKVRV